MEPCKNIFSHNFPLPLVRFFSPTMHPRLLAPFFPARQEEGEDLGKFSGGNWALVGGGESVYARKLSYPFLEFFKIIRTLPRKYVCFEDCFEFREFG